MGLLGGLLQIGGGILGTILTGEKNKKAIKKASAAEQAAINAAIAEQRRQYDQTREDYAPWRNAGLDALAQIEGLTGLRGDTVQNERIRELLDTPLYRSLYESGEEAILANASATGGLRGGNMQRGLAEFGRDTLTSVIEQQLARLGGLSGTSVGLTQSLAGHGANTATNVGQFLGQIGQSRAGSILGRQAVNNNTIDQIHSMIAQAIGGGPF